MLRGAGRRIPVLAAVIPLAIIAPAAPLAAASYPPHYHFRTVSSDRVSVHFHDPLEPMARQAASIASEILQRHEQRYGLSVGRVQLVLVDVDDFPAMVDAVQLLATDQGMRLEMGRRAREYCLERFTLEATTDRWRQVLRGLTSSNTWGN